MNAMLTHKLNNLKAKSQGYKFFGDDITSRQFMGVVKQIQCSHLKTLDEVEKELKRQNLNEK